MDYWVPNGKILTLKTKIKDILGDEWVLNDKYAEERLDLIDLLSELGREAVNRVLTSRHEERSAKSRLLHQVGCNTDEVTCTTDHQ